MVETLSEKILCENDAVLAEMLEHRFITDVKNNTLTNQAFERYLAYEGVFVDTAISVFAYATATAERIDQRRWLISVLAALANEQIVYFERTFASRAIVPSSFATNIPEVSNFCGGMLSIARNGGF